MKNYQWLLYISLFAVTSTLLGCQQTNQVVQKSDAVVQETKQVVQENNQVVFSCKTNNDGEHITTAKYQNKTRDLIIWQRGQFTHAGYPPQRRCQEVTPKLQTAYDNGTLPTLTWGYSEADDLKRYKSLCTTTGKECHTLILTLLESDDADNELKKFTAVLNGDASRAYQNSSCKTPQTTGANLTCSVDIFKVFND